jgi:hypothetical protein
MFILMVSLVISFVVPAVVKSAVDLVGQMPAIYESLVKVLDNLGFKEIDAWSVIKNIPVEKIIDKVRPEIARAVSDRKLRDGIAIPLTGALRQSVDRIEAMLRKQLDDIKTDFEKERVAKPQEMFDKSADERKRIAEANKAERIDVIEPLRERIEAFASIVAEELAM